MPRYLDPKVDLTFKQIFGNHPDLLIDFLNAVMPFAPDRWITEVEYLPSELVPDTPTKKYSIVDVRCKDNYQRMFIIEMQMFWNSDFYNRIVFNAGKAYVRQLNKADQYHLLQPVYTLALLNDNFDKKTERFYHHFQIVNRENTDEIIPGLEFVLVELTEKFKPENLPMPIGGTQARAMRVLWLRFLAEVNEKMTTLPKEMQENDNIRKAAELCERAAYTPEELLKYEASLEHIRIERAIREGTRRDALVEGEAIGVEKGIAIGVQKNEAERAQLQAQLDAAHAEKLATQSQLDAAHAEKLETQAQLDAAHAEKLAANAEKLATQAQLDAAQNATVLNCHQAGIPLETISKITGLPVEQIKQIIKQIK
jgi:predicted transposase/invertase (TIGR01784 family)